MSKVAIVCIVPKPKPRRKKGASFFSAKFKLEAIKFSDKTNITTAAKQYKVNRKTIALWRRQRIEIEKRIGDGNGDDVAGDESKKPKSKNSKFPTLRNLILNIDEVPLTDFQTIDEIIKCEVASRTEIKCVSPPPADVDLSSPDLAGELGNNRPDLEPKLDPITSVNTFMKHSRKHGEVIAPHRTVRKFERPESADDRARLLLDKQRERERSLVITYSKNKWIARSVVDEWLQDLVENKKLVRKCKCCSQMFTRPEGYIQHFNTEHKGEEGLHDCFECDQTFKTGRERLIHEKNSHSFRCDICNNEFVKRNYLQTHILTQHNTNYDCDLCWNTTFKTKERLDTHMNSHVRADFKKKKYLPRIPILCSICDISFESDKHLELHNRLKHKNAANSSAKTE